MDISAMQALKLDVALRLSGDLRHDVAQIKRAEQLGYDAVWVSEMAHNPFFPLSLDRQATNRIRLVTQDAARLLAAQWSPLNRLGSARQPMVDSCWAGHAAAGRILSAVSAKDWQDPAGRMRE